jgi:hypothetical protein
MQLEFNAKADKIIINADKVKSEQTVLFNHDDDCFIINGKTYFYAVGAFGHLSLHAGSERSMSEDSLTGMIIQELRSAFDIDMVLRRCLVENTFSDLVSISKLLEAGAQPVMKLSSEGILVAMHVGDFEIQITDGHVMLNVLKYTENSRKFWQCPVITGDNQDVVNDVYYNLFIINGTSYAFDKDAKGDFVLVEVDWVKYHEMIDMIISKMRPVFDVEMVLRRCLSENNHVALDDMVNELVSGAIPRMFMCTDNLIVIRFGTNLIPVTDGQLMVSIPERDV